MSTSKAIVTKDVLGAVYAGARERTVLTRSRETGCLSIETPESAATRVFLGTVDILCKKSDIQDLIDSGLTKKEALGSIMAALAKGSDDDA